MFPNGTGPPLTLYGAAVTAVGVVSASMPLLELQLRFDLRVPPLAKTDHATQYRACLEMVEWGERMGFQDVTLSEHHNDDAGYLPAPLTLAAAILGRTARIKVSVSAALVPLHDPLRIAEQLAVLELIGPGRISA